MHDLARSEEFYYLVHVRIVAHTENVVIGGSRLLLRRKILNKIGNGIRLGLKVSRLKRHARRVRGIDRVAVINVVIAVSVLVEALGSLAVGELPYDAADDLKVRQFFLTLTLSMIKGSAYLILELFSNILTFSTDCVIIEKRNGRWQARPNLLCLCIGRSFT